MKSRLMAAGAVMLAVVSLVFAGGVEMGRGRWFQHPVLYPPVETIGAGGTITADACGGQKRITSTAARTTDTTDTFTAPSDNVNSGCEMTVVNVGPYAITLDYNANFHAAGAANVVLGASDTVRVAAIGGWDNGGPYWVQIGATGDN